MSGFLSPYHTAVLQQMGICVWEKHDTSDSVSSVPKPARSQDATASTVPNPSNSQSTAPPQNRAQRLAELRSTLTSAEQSPSKTRATVSANSAATKKSDPPSEIPFSQLQQVQYAAFCQDVEQALRYVSKDFQDAQPQWFIGSVVSIDVDRIVLPALPDVLSWQHKRVLWEKITQLPVSA